MKKRRLTLLCYLSLYLPVLPTLVVLATLLHSSPLWASNIVASVDRNRLTIEETLTLSIQVSEQVGLSSPNFDQLDQHFETLSSNRSNRFHSINGKVESYTIWQLVLAPKSTGTLLIPSFEYKGQYSNAIKIEVVRANQNVRDPQKSIFLETTLENTEVYVQQQLLLTVRLNTKVNIQSYNNEELTLPDARIELISEQKYQRRIGGVGYGVIELVYAIFPQTSGQLDIPVMTWSITTQGSRSRSLFDPFGSTPRGKVMRLRTEAKKVVVKPKPTQYPNTVWLPATNINLQQSWSNDPNTFQVGEPITRTITIAAKGLTASQLPPIPNLSIAAVKVYPDQQKPVDSRTDSGIVGKLSQSQAIVPTRAGTFVLPEIKINWWDTQKDQLREAKLPAQTIEVSPSLSAQTATAPSIQTAELNQITGQNTRESKQGIEPLDSGVWTELRFWQGLSFTFACLSLVLGLVLAYQIFRGKTLQRVSHDTDIAPTTNLNNSSEALKQLQQSAQQNDALLTRNALLNWAQVHWGKSMVASLDDLIERLNNQDIKKQVRLLDAAAFSNGATPNLSSIVEYAKQETKRNPLNTGKKSPSTLPPLYST